MGLIKNGIVLGTAAYGYSLTSGLTSREDQSNDYSSGIIGAVAGLGIGGTIAYKWKDIGEYSADSVVEFGKALNNNKGTIAKTALTAGTAATKLGLETTKTIGKTGLNVTVGLADTISEHFLKDAPGENLLNTKLNKKGMLAAGLITIGSTLLGANETYEENRKGNNFNSSVVTSTPNFENTDSFQNYYNNSAEAYGASGDLVFALNKNRRG